MKAYIYLRKFSTLFKLLFHRVLFPFYKKLGTPKVLSIDETLNLIIEKKLSISRFGDSEYIYMIGKNDGLQSSNCLLQKKLKEVLQNNNPRLLVCMVDYLNETDKNFFGKLSGSNFYVKTFKIIKPYLSFDYVYGNSNVTRFYINNKNKVKSIDLFNKWKQVWNNKDIIIFEGINTRFGVGNDLLDNAKSIKRVLCPSKQAFDSYDKIINFMTSVDKNVVIFLALGVTATIVASELSNQGYQAIDIGNLDIEYEWFRVGAKKKVLISGKQISEISGGTNVSAVDDPDYLTQIISRIDV